MDLAAAWIAAPLGLIVIVTALGCAPAAIVGSHRAPRQRALPGFALLVVLGSVWITWVGRPALTAAVIILLAVAAVATAHLRGLRFSRPDVHAVGAGLLAFAVYAAPVIMSGTPTWAGWVKLDDGGSFLAFTDAMFTTGRNGIDATPTSTYERLIDIAFPGYPVGSFVPLGVAHGVTGIDSAWLLQPYLAVLAALLAVGLHQSMAPLSMSPWLRATSAGVAASAATLYGYALWGGIKELVVPLIILTAALAVRELACDRSVQYGAGLILAVAIAAVLFASGIRGLGYPLVVLAAGALVVAHERRVLAPRVVAMLAVVGVCLVGLGATVLAGRIARFAHPIADIGNLFAPLQQRQMFGVWLGADFRVAPQFPLLTNVLLVVVACCAALGIVECLVRRAWAPLVFAGVVVSTAFLSTSTAGAWLTGKAIAMASPAVAALALIGATSLRTGGLTVRNTRAGAMAAAVTIAVVAGGIAVSDALQYHGVWLAPRGPVHELEVIGEEFAGQGPALMVEYSVYGARHFLREVKAESISDLRVNLIPLRSGAEVQKGGWADIDAVSLSDVQRYPLLVVRTGPATSRPPSSYTRVWAGEYYDVWRRDPARGTVVAGVSLGSTFEPTGAASCRDVLALAAKAPAGGMLVAAAREPVIVVPLGASGQSATWVGGTATSGADRMMTTRFELQASRRYRAWIAGSYPGVVRVTVDGKAIYEGHSMINFNDDQTYPVGPARLAAGSHTLRVKYSQPWWLPGSGAGPFALGPLLLSTGTGADARLIGVPPRAARSLCGRRFDWIQLVQPASP